MILPLISVRLKNSIFPNEQYNPLPFYDEDTRAFFAVGLFLFFAFFDELFS